MIKVKDIIIGIVIGMLAISVRLVGIGSFMTADEENWMMRSNEFYAKLAAGDISGTFLTSHPGATGMWIMGAGIVVKEKISGVELDDNNVIGFRKAATVPVAIVVSGLIGLVAYLLSQIWGKEMAWLAGIMLALEPYVVGMSMVAHLDMLQAMLMLTSLLWFIQFRRRRKTGYLITSAVFAGAALGVKMVLAFWLGPVAGLMWMIDLYWERGKNWKRVLGEMAMWGVIAVVVLVILWPTMLTRKDFQLGYIAKDTQTVLEDEHVALEISDEPISPASFYVRTVLGRVTPWVQILSIAAVVYVLYAAVKRRDKGAQTMVWMIVYAVGFLVLISLAAKKGDRYAMPALVIGPILSGWMLAQGMTWWHSKKRDKLILIGLVVILAGVTWWRWAPYAIAYNNPIFPNVRSLSQQGWGEGLDLAADWLNENPLGDKLTVASWYPNVMRPYFQGKVFSLSARDDYRVGYIITYRNMGGRALDDQASNVLDEVKDKTPVHTVSIHGVPYAWIYETMTVGYFTKHVGELTSGMEVGQTVQPEQDNWNAVEIGFATFSSRNNTAEVVLEIKERPDSATALRRVTVNASEIIDNEWKRFEFDPITEAAGHEFYVAITSPDGTAGNAVTVRYIDEDLRPGNMFLQRKGETEPVAKSGDIAYQL